METARLLNMPIMMELLAFDNILEKIVGRHERDDHSFGKEGVWANIGV